MLVVMQELGRGLVVEPYWRPCWAPRCCAWAAPAGEEPLLEQVARGRAEAGRARWANGSRATTCSTSRPRASADGERHALSGNKTVVVHGAQAGALIVPAGGRHGGIALFVVPGDAAGVNVTDYRTLDGQRAADDRVQRMCRAPARWRPRARLGDARTRRRLRRGPAVRGSHGRDGSAVRPRWTT